MSSDQTATGYVTVMSQIQACLALPRDPFRLQAPKPEVSTDARIETCPKCEEDTSNTPAPSIKVQNEVKEERESLSGSSRTPLPTQSNQSSSLKLAGPMNLRESTRDGMSKRRLSLKSH